ncbi:hypothetical protein LXL04_007879 [Taraxacum kok-saghyz]
MKTRGRAHPLTVEEPTITMTVSGTYWQDYQTAATMIDISVTHSFVSRSSFFRFSHIRVVSGNWQANGYRGWRTYLGDILRMSIVSYVSTRILIDISVVSGFSNVFPKEFLACHLSSKGSLRIILVPGATPVAKSTYWLIFTVQLLKCLPRISLSTARRTYLGDILRMSIVSYLSTRILIDISVVSGFSNVFPKEFLGCHLSSKGSLRIILVPGATPVAKSTYWLIFTVQLLKCLPRISLSTARR